MKRVKKFSAAVLSAIVLAGCLQSYDVFAGASTNIIDKASYEQDFNTSVWSNPDADVTAENVVIHFPATSTKYTRLITQAMMEQAEGSDELVHVTYRQNIASIPAGGKFILGFGLGSVESFSADQGQVEVAFIHDGSLKVAIDSYETAGEAVSISGAKAAGCSKGSSAAIDVTVKNNKSIVVKVNGKTVAEETLPFLPEGSVGFFQSGECKVDVSDLSIKSYRYDNPENSNFTETFDDGQYNSNLLFSSANAAGYLPSTMSVEEYEGNYVMFYENSGPASISTKQKYSNFELTFDVPYLLRNNITDESGEITHPRSAWVGVSFGDESIEYNGYGYEYAQELVYYQVDSSIRAFSHNDADMGRSDKYKFFDSKETRGFTARVSVVDAHVTVGVKWIEEEKFTTIAEYDMPNSQTPLGYVHIWTCGPANFAIDNIEMKNLDEKPKLVEVEYKSSKVNAVPDYEYTEDLGGEEQAADAGLGKFSWYYTIPLTTVVMAVAIVITAVVSKSKKKKAERRSELSEQ